MNFGSLLGGIATGGTAMYIAKQRRKEREDRAARLAAAAASRAVKDAPPPSDTANTGLKEPEVDSSTADSGDSRPESVAEVESPNTGAGDMEVANTGILPPEDFSAMADGGMVYAEEKKKPKEEPKEDLITAAGRKSRMDKIEGMANGGEVGESARHERMPGDYNEDLAEGEIESAPAASYRDAGKRRPARAKGGEFQTEVAQMMNGGGMVPIGYSIGGILNGNNLPGGYVQHGSTTQTSDPMWNMECHRDFGKKGPA